MTKNVPLSDSVPFAGRHVSELTFRAPKMREYAQFGEPSVVTRTGDGGFVLVENTDAIFAYARALVSADMTGVLEHLSLRDTLAVKDAILGFFEAARAAGETPPPDSSPSTLDGSGRGSSAN